MIRTTESEFPTLDDNDRELYMVNRDELRDGHDRELIEIEVFTAPDAVTNLFDRVDDLLAGTPTQSADGWRTMLRQTREALHGARREHRAVARSEALQRSSGARAAIAIVLTLLLGILIGQSSCGSSSAGESILGRLAPQQ